MLRLILPATDRNMATSPIDLVSITEILVSICYIIIKGNLQVLIYLCVRNTPAVHWGCANLSIILYNIIIYKLCVCISQYSVTWPSHMLRPVCCL